MSQRLKWRHALMVSVVGLVLSFQNCAQVADESSESSFESGLPFAYSAKIDTLAYMSCSEMRDTYAPLDKRAYFTFRAGAYNSKTGGLSLTSEFRDQTQYYDPTQRAQLFGMSEKNSNTLLSLSVRKIADVQIPWVVGTLAAGEELDNMLPSLDSPNIAGPLGASKAGTMINYFPGDATQRLIEGSLRFYEYENTAALTRNTLTTGNESMLVVSYSDTADPSETALRIPEQVDSNNDGKGDLPDNRAYGTGYKLSFSFPQGYSGGLPRVLSSGSSISEIDLKTGKPQMGVWDCNQSYQFMVVRPQDKANGLVSCDTIPDKAANSTQASQLAVIRRVLRVEDWFVDVARRCIVPKRTADYCYGDLHLTSSTERTIQYGLASCTNSGTTACPHFVSVCIRQ